MKFKELLEASTAKVKPKTKEELKKNYFRYNIKRR